MRTLIMLLILLAASAASVHEPDFPTLSDQILWKSEYTVCQSDPYECVGLAHMTLRCCRIRTGLI